MEPIKPIEGNLKDGEGQASVLAEVVRTRYWKQLAQEMPPVKKNAETSLPENKPDDQEAVEEKNTEAKIKARHTYAEFEINQETREVLVRIFDAENGELIRTVPPEELAKEIARGNLQPNQLRRRAVFI
jgi:uncharacterized FlaG/YvyC family protein